MYVGLYRYLQFGFLLTKDKSVHIVVPLLTIDHLVVLLLESVENKMAKRLFVQLQLILPFSSFNCYALYCVSVRA